MAILSFAASARAQYSKATVGSFTTTSSTFTDVPGGYLIFKPGAVSEVWVLLFSAKFGSTPSGLVGAEVRYLVNGVEHGFGGTENSIADSPGPWQHFYRVTGTTAVQTVQVQIRDADASNDPPTTATIQDLQIIAFKVPAGADFQFVETEGAQTVAMQFWNTYQTFSFTPASPGSYLILGLANGTEWGGSTSIGLRFVDPVGAFWPIADAPLQNNHFNNGRGPLQSYFVARSQNLAAIPQTYRIEAVAQPDGPGPPPVRTATVQYTRFMAFRTDAFDAFETAEVLGETSTTSTTPVVKAGLTTSAPPGTRDYVVIQSQRLRGGNFLRYAGFQRDGVPGTNVNDGAQSGGFRVSYGYFDALTTSSSHLYENTFWSPDGVSSVEAEESVIHVLRMGSGGGDLNAFSCRKTIAIDRAQVGEATTTTLSDFPLLFSVTDPDLRTVANGGTVVHPSGYDIIFRAMDTGTCGGPSTCNLDFEVEKYVPTTGELVAWVRLPSVNGQAATSDTRLYVFYGNCCMTSSWENPTAVWDSGFSGVWHLKEDPGGGAPQAKDSTTNANDATSSGGMNSADQVAGKIDGNLDFDTVDDHLSATSASFSITGAITLEAWVYPRFPALADADRGIFSRKNEVANDCGYTIEWSRFWGSFNSWMKIGGTWYNAGAPITYDAFQHVVATFDGSDLRFYKNGSLVTTTPASGAICDPGLQPLRIGRNNDLGSPPCCGQGDWYHDGLIDEARVSNVARPTEWIVTSYNNQNNPGDIGSPGFYTVGGALCPAPTAVELSSFSATGHDGECLIEWTTASELNNLGFLLHRASSEGGPYQRLTASAIPGLGSSPVGAHYRYVDSGLQNGRTYYYKLEDVETTGKTKLHGPVAATPKARGLAPAPSPPLPTGVTYGEPSAVSMRVLERSETHMVLELRTRGFHAEPLPDGSVDLSVPGFVKEPDSGAPSIPVWRSWLEIAAGRNVRLVSAETEEIEAFSSLRPSVAAATEMVAGAGGTVRLVRRHRRARGVPPEEPARIVSTGYQGEAKKALLEIRPLRWDGRTLSMARRVTVRLAFTGKEDVASHRESRSHRRQSVVRRLLTRERGLYGVRFEELMGASRDALETGSLRLSRQGKAVPFHVEPDRGVFGPGSTLFFVSEGSSLNPYGRDAVYEIERGEGVTMPVDSASRPGPPVRRYRDRLVKEENHYYQPGLLDAKDLWLWDLLLAPVRKSYAVELSGLLSTTEPARLEVSVQGVSDFPANPDHHLRLYLNGTLVVEDSFDGKKGRELGAEIPPGVLREGVNQLEIENVGDTGASYSMVMLDRYEISYPRTMSALGDTLEGTFSESGSVELGDRFVLDLTESVPRWRSAGGSTVRVESTRRYLAVKRRAVLEARMEERRESRLKSRLNQADYLVVGPKPFLDAATTLLDSRRRQGLRTHAVPVEEVYSEFGFGESRPEAIRDFLSYAYHHWRRPAPRYVLLLGDGSYDFKDYLKTGVLNQVPPLLTKTSFLWTASDPAYASVNGEDPLPDLAIGRLPAASVEEVRVMVEKILAYEAGGTLSGGPVVLVADNPDDAGNFVFDSEELAGEILAPRHPQKIYLDLLGRDATRAAISAAFDRGASLLSYAGHGGIHLWASENVFDNAQVATLAPQSQQPVVLTLNCLNGYFHFPYFNSLGEELLKAKGKGAIAAFSPSGLSLNEPAHLFHLAITRELVSGGHRRLGDAVLSAQAAYAGTGAFPELLRIYHLLGDPALRLR